MVADRLDDDWESWRLARRQRRWLLPLLLLREHGLEDSAPLAGTLGRRQAAAKMMQPRAASAF
jgi:hypothetical protein